MARRPAGASGAHPRISPFILPPPPWYQRLRNWEYLLLFSIPCRPPPPPSYNQATSRLRAGVSGSWGCPNKYTPCLNSTILYIILLLGRFRLYFPPKSIIDPSFPFRPSTHSVSVQTSILSIHQSLLPFHPVCCRASRHVGLATWRLDNLATWQLGTIATWQLGNSATRQLGDLGRRCNR